MPIFCQKNVSSLKNIALMSFFFKFLMKNLYQHAHNWSKNANSVKNILYYGPKDSIGCPFFLSIFHEKIDALMPIYCQKNRPFCEKHVALMPIFCQKKVHSLKTRFSHVIFQFFYEKTPYFAFIHKIGQKNVNSVKTTLYYGPKELIGCFYFSSFHEKIIALMPIFCQKMSLL